MRKKNNFQIVVFFVSIAFSGDVDDVSRSGYVWINQDAKGEVTTAGVELELIHVDIQVYLEPSKGTPLNNRILKGGW